VKGREKTEWMGTGEGVRVEGWTGRERSKGQGEEKGREEKSRPHVHFYKVGGAYATCME